MQDSTPSSLRYHAAREFVSIELQRVIAHIPVIYDTRDRFFTNFMTVSLALYGFLGFIFKEPTSSTNIVPFSFFMLVVLVVLGMGTLFLVTGNWLARDFYRQRCARLQRLLLEPDDAALAVGLQGYLKFSRDQTKWRYRVTSIYFIYNTAIALSNGIASTFAIHVALRKLTLGQMGACIGILLVAQHAGTLLYLWIYRRGGYHEG